jgi:hypothetical protein
VMIRSIDENDSRRRTFERLSGCQSAKPPADDHYTWEVVGMRCDHGLPL